MKKSKWYRKPVMKSVLICLVHLSLIGALLSGTFLLSMGDMVADFREKSYVKTSAYGSTLQKYATHILQALDGQDYLNLTSADGEKNAVNLRTGKISAVKGKNTAKGELMYSLEDLKKWSETTVRWEYGSYGSELDNILVFQTDEGSYHYYYAREFVKKIEDKQIEITLRPDAETYTSPGAVLDDIKEEFQGGANYFYFSDWDIQEIRDTEGNFTYIDGWFYDGEMIREIYAPVGHENILSVVNESDYWNGKLSEAYDVLLNAVYKMSEAVSGQEVLRQFGEGNTNMTYLYVLPAQKKLYTNCMKYEEYADYKGTVKKIEASPSHIVVYPQLSKSSVTFDASLQEWQTLVSGYTKESGEEYIFAISVNTDFPIADTLAESNNSYRENAGKVLPAFQLLIFSAIIFLFCIVWLTVTAGRKVQDEEVHLYSADHFFTEISAAVIFLPWLGVTGLGISACDAFDYTSPLRRSVIVTTLVFLALFTAAMFLTGYLSLVRRIKSGTLYQDSLLKWLIQLLKKCWRRLKRLLLSQIPEFMDDIMKNARSEVRIILSFGGFLLLQFFLVLIGCSGGTAVCILFLIPLDLAAVYVFVRRAAGRQRILEGLRRITDGELEYKIPVQKLKGEQKRIAEYINCIGEGLDAAVEKSLRNERMKTELITNVSHDIKTPLTSIINYIELLKRENFTDEKVLGYLNVLDQKAQRLKTLTEDVVEASKASTGNISLEKMNLDMAEMVKQADGEFEEAFLRRGLRPIVTLPKDPVVIHVDGRRLWRVLANVYLNVSKYAMEGTRVYEDLTVKNGKAVFSIKNISAEPLNISADELTERFIRGDGSRTTEGSGLGLSIAKSLTELQGGSFTLILDGDLFKVTISFPLVS